MASVAATGKTSAGCALVILVMMRSCLLLQALHVTHTALDNMLMTTTTAVSL
jgi:hypothetical protein